MNLPNILSISRVLLLAPIIFLFEYEFYLASLIIFIIASVTDYLDGYFARKNNLSSNIGALLDLLADKIFVATLLVWITYSFENIFILISSILIISREISISYLRLYIISNTKKVDDVKFPTVKILNMFVSASHSENSITLCIFSAMTGTVELYL